MIVLDASALVALLLDPTSPTARAIGTRLSAPDESVHVPHLLDLEVAQVLRRSLFRGDVSPRRAAVALDDLVGLRAVRYPHWPLLERVWALRPNLTAYDAVYVALSETLGAPLLTLDEAIQRAPGHHARVEVPSG